jgi:hypothetical protein
MKLIIQVISILLIFQSTSYSQSFFDFGKPKVVEPCNVYWNGREFKLGSTKGDNNFVRLSQSRYGIETVIVSLPKPMGDEFGVTNKKTKENFSLDGEMKKFMDENWDQITKLCKLKN